MPARRQCAGFRFAITDDASDDQIRIVEGSAISMRKGIAQFATLIDRSGSFGGHMAGYPAWKRELLEQLLHSFRIG